MIRRSIEPPTDEQYESLVKLLCHVKRNNKNIKLENIVGHDTIRSVPDWRIPQKRKPPNLIKAHCFTGLDWRKCYLTQNLESEANSTLMSSHRTLAACSDSGGSWENWEVNDSVRNSTPFHWHRFAPSWHYSYVVIANDSPRQRFVRPNRRGSDTPCQRISIAAFLTRPYIDTKPYWTISDWRY